MAWADDDGYGVAPQERLQGRFPLGLLLAHLGHLLLDLIHQNRIGGWVGGRVKEFMNEN